MCAYKIIPLQRDDSDFADFFGDSDGGSFFGEIDEALKVKDPSVEYYPEPFCDMVEGERGIRQSFVEWNFKFVMFFQACPPPASRTAFSSCGPKTECLTSPSTGKLRI